MMINGISLQSFRSFQQQTLLFDTKLTYIVGKNTAGKTNILEAIALLSTGKSFRGVGDKDMIAWNTDMARVKAKVAEEELEIVITKGMVNGIKTPYKKYLVNGVSKRAVDAIGILKSIVFSPEDVDLVTGSPTIRRHFLDFILCQCDKEYRRSLAVYEKALRQRNKLLFLIHEGVATREQLAFWDRVVIEHGQYISAARQRFLTFSSTVTVPEKQFLAVYDYSEISPERLAKYANEEVAAKATLVGPHRDDIVLQIFKPQGRSVQAEAPSRDQSFVDVSVFGSRGEQRLSVLWLKLAALEYIVETTGERPVLLLDDIFSELDQDHQSVVISLIKTYQTIITSADDRAIADVQRIESGTVIAL